MLASSDMVLAGFEIATQGHEKNILASLLDKNLSLWYVFSETVWPNVQVKVLLIFCLLRFVT